MGHTLPAHMIERAKAEAKRADVRCDSFAQTLVREGRIDGNLGLAVGEQLKHVSREIVKQRFPDIQFRTFIPPVRDTPAPSADTYEWHTATEVGVAETAHTLAGSTKKVGFGIEAEPNSVPLRYERASYDFADDELIEAAAAGVSISTEKPRVCRHAIERKKDLVMMLGHAATGRLGLLSDGNVPEINAGADQLGVTFEVALQNLKNWADQVHFDSNGIYRATRLLMPAAYYKFYKNKRATDGSGRTVLEEFLATNGTIQRVDWSIHCDTASDSNGPVALFYPYDPDMVGFIESVLYRESQPTRNGFTSDIEAYGRIGGVAWRHPNSGLKVGLDA